MIRTVEREAKKRHTCESCTLVIEPGDYYLEHVASPNHDDLGNGHWWRLTECGDCAERCGRALTKGAPSADCTKHETCRLGAESNVAPE